MTPATHARAVRRFKDTEPAERTAEIRERERRPTMRRRRDRGELGAAELWPVVILLFAITMGIVAVSLRLRTANGHLKRLADAVCVEAPPAEPAEEVTPDGD